MSFEEVETCELNRMKYNTFKVCEEVSQRVDRGVAPGGCIEVWVTLDEDSLFFWDQKHLHHYLANKDNQSEVSIPGENYYVNYKVENFMKNHFIKGEKYSEFLKFSCQETCHFCNKYGWYDEICERIPESFPDYTCEDKFKYLHMSVTPTEERVVNDYKPRFNLKAEYEKHSFVDPDSIENFSKKFIIPSALVQESINELRNQEIQKQIRLNERKKLRESEKASSFEDFVWYELATKDTRKKSLVTTTDRYLKHHKMNQCLKLKKLQKVETISAHVLSNFQGIKGNCDSPIGVDEVEEVEAEDDEEGSDGEADENEDEVLRVTCNEKKMDSEEEDVIEKSNAYDIYEYDDSPVDYNRNDKPLIVTTRSGRSPGNCRLSLS